MHRRLLIDLRLRDQSDDREMLYKRDALEKVLVKAIDILILRSSPRRMGTVNDARQVSWLRGSTCLVSLPGGLCPPVVDLTRHSPLTVAGQPRISVYAPTVFLFDLSNREPFVPATIAALPGRASLH